MVKLYATRNNGSKIYTTRSFVELSRLARKFERRGYENLSLGSERYRRCAHFAQMLNYGNYEACWICREYEDICLAANMLRYNTLCVNVECKYIYFSEMPDVVNLYKNGFKIIGLSKDYDKEWGGY